MDLRLCIVTAAVPELGRDHYDVAMAAINGGATAIQLRIKRRGMGEALKIANEIHAAANEAGVSLIVNDHVGIAMASKAEGLHTGPDDISISAARKMLGRKVIIGRSTGGKPADAVKAEQDGADYIGVGPVFSTSTKNGVGPAIGAKQLTKIKAVVKIPVIAVGGIDISNLAQCFKAGADGVAVISAVTMADDMHGAVIDLRMALDKVDAEVKPAAPARSQKR